MDSSASITSSGLNLNLRDGDKPIALSKENGSDIETCGSPKNALQLRLGSFFGASVRGIALKYFNVNPFLQVNKNSHFFQVFQRYMYACGIFFLVKTKYFYHRLSRRSCHLFLSSSDRDLCQKYCGKYQPASCKLSYPHTFSKDDPTGNDREYRLKAHDH